MKILVFTKKYKDEVDFPQDVREGLNVEHISFDSTKLDDLLKIAQYRVINYPTSIILNNKGKVLLKIRGSIPDGYVNNILATA